MMQNDTFRCQPNVDTFVVPISLSTTTTKETKTDAADIASTIIDRRRSLKRDQTTLRTFGIY
jgi:hypothetical protein